MPVDVVVAVHVLVGSLALAAYWAALGSRKGTPRHRLAGGICLLALVCTGPSVAPVLFMRPGPFDPANVVQTVYLTVCLVTVSTIAFTAIRFKAAPERFRGLHFRVLGPVMLVLGLVVLIAGLANGNPVAVALSWVGLAYGAGMIAFARHRGALHPRWWMGWHLNAVCGLFNAVHGTVMYVAARSAGLVSEGPVEQAAFQLLTLAAAIAMRLWFGVRYKAPLRFGQGAKLQAA